MQLFDLHCDTLYRAATEKECLTDNHFHISFKKAQTIRPWIQCMAVWIPDTMRGEQAFLFVLQCAEMLEQQLKCTGGQIRKIETGREIKKVQEASAAGIVLTVEGGAALAGKLQNIKKLRALGVRMMTLTWNGENELGYGCLAPGKGGLKPFGRAALQEMEKNGVVADLSHASEHLFYDVAETAKRPFVASHSNARRICNHPRNLTDEQFCMIRDKGGIVGINFCRSFLRADENAGFADILSHIEHFLSLGGENTVCIGSDFDGTDMPDGIKGIADMEGLYTYFLRHNYRETLLRKVFFENAAQFCENFDKL